MLDRRSLSILIAVLAVHVALAIAYAAVTPYRTGGYVSGIQAIDIGAPDERQHANYIQYVLDGNGVPVLDVARMQSDPAYRHEAYERHQPPLYYFVAAGWSKLVGVSNVNDPSAGWRLRLLSALFGAATVAGVYFAAWWGFRRTDLAIAASLFPALLPMSVGLSGAVSNDPMLFAEFAWSAALCARAVRQGWNLKLAILIGTLAGLAVLTKTSGLAILPMTLTAFLVPHAARPKLWWIAAAAAAWLMIAGPWFLRNENVYHDPLAAGVFKQAFQDSPSKDAIIKGPLAGESSPEIKYWTDWVGWWTARSFVGVFGYMDIWLNETGNFSPRAKNLLYRLVLGALSVLAVGWLLSLREDWAREAKGVTVVNLVLLVVVVALFIQFDNQFFQAQARYLYPAMTPIAIGFGSGAITLAKTRTRGMIGGIAAILLLLNIYAITVLQGEFPQRTSGYGGVNGGVQ